MFITVCTFFITSTGHGEPAMIPVRSDEKSNRENSGCSSSAMNMVGTPYSAVQRSSCTASMLATGSNDSAGTTMPAPCVVQARLPSTMPKQW